MGQFDWKRFLLFVLGGGAIGTVVGALAKKPAIGGVLGALGGGVISVATQIVPPVPTIPIERIEWWVDPTLLDLVTIERIDGKVSVKSSVYPPPGRSACCIDYYLAEIIPKGTRVKFVTFGEKGRNEMAIYDCRQNLRAGPSVGHGRVLYNQTVTNEHVLTVGCTSLHLYFYWSPEDLLNGQLSFFIEDPKLQRS